MFAKLVVYVSCFSVVYAILITYTLLRCNHIFDFVSQLSKKLV